jgi:putative ABC transport system substrate-binding protein
MCFQHSILKGTKPSDLSIPAGGQIRAGINLKTAKELGLTMPPNSLAIADEVVE